MTLVKTSTLTAAALVVIFALGYFITKGVVKPVSTDLSVIGQGKPTLVLAYENFSPNGGEALDRIRQVRAEYESRLHFVVADLGTPQGRAFANRFGMVDGQAVFLKPDGQPLQVIRIPADGREFRTRLDHKLAAVES